MSVARVDGTAARPLDWGDPAGQPAKRRRSRPTAPGRSRDSAPERAPSRRRDDAPGRRTDAAPGQPARSAGTAAASRRAKSALTPGQVWLFGICWLAIVAGAVAVVSRQAAIAEAGYRITAAENKLAELNHENMLLEAEVARLADPERIYRIATEQLGMVPRERFEVTVVATAEPVVRPGQQGVTVASTGAILGKAAGNEGFWSSLGRTVVGWLTGQSPTAAAKTPDE